MTNALYKPYYRNSWAFVIGINAYQFAPQLSYACNDADSVSAVLVEELGFPTHQVIVLKDDVATKQAILAGFDDLIDKATDLDDRLLIFFAGHGTTVDSYNRQIGCLVPVDGNAEKISSLVRWDDLTRGAELIKAKHVLFIMDACYSGLAMQRAMTLGEERFLNDLLQRFSRQVITAGKADQMVADGGGPRGKNSIFTGYLLKGLQGAAINKNGILTATDLMAYVYKEVGQNNQSHQTPVYGHLEGDGDFILRTPNNQHLQAEQHSDYLIATPIEVPETSGSHASTAIKPTFAIKNGYADPAHPNFGRNDWSRLLSEIRRGQDITSDYPRALSWLSLIIEPSTTQAVTVDISSETNFLSMYAPTGEPFERLRIPKDSSRTTINSIIFYRETSTGKGLWDSYIRVDKQGNMEYATSAEVFIELRGIRAFRYVPVIGLVWQFMFFAKQILARYNYAAGARLLVNLVGTRDTVLADFSREPGENNKRWVEPFEGGAYFSPSGPEPKCADPNLQMEYQFVCANLNEKKSFEVVNNIARQLGLAYNHKSEPRCFNYYTTIFPWKQYLTGRL